MPSEPRLPAKITKRRDKKLVLRARTQFWQKFLDDLPFWYDLVKAQATLATREQDPAVRMACKMIDKLLIEQREVEDTSPPVRVPLIQVIIGVGIERGTSESRAKALQDQANERMTLTLDGEDSRDPDSVRPESLDNPVPQFFSES